MARHFNPDLPRRRHLARQGAPPTSLSPREADAHDRALDVIVSTLGGRQRLTDTLAIAADAPEVEPLLTLLLDPRFESWSLRTLCHRANLTVVDLFSAYKRAMVVKAQLLATEIIANKLLPVVEDVMRRAAPYEVPCSHCASTGRWTDPEATVPADVCCPQCAGHGKVLQLPDLDRQKLALDLAQLVQKPGGLQIQQNVQVAGNGASPGHALVDLQQAVRQLLSGPRTPLPVYEGEEVHDDVAATPIEAGP